MSNPTSTRQNCLLQKIFMMAAHPERGNFDFSEPGKNRYSHCWPPCVCVSLSVRTIHTYTREYSVLCMTKISSFFMIAGHENVLELHTGSMYRASESEHSYTRWWQCGKLECLACARQLTNYGRPLLLLQEE